MSQRQEILDVRNVNVRFPVKKGGLRGAKAFVNAVNGVSFSVRQGETLGLVGESGCGKTTLGRALLRLVPVTVEGEVRFDGKDVSGMHASEFRAVRRDMQMIFQDPFSSLNPRLTIGQMLSEVLRVHRVVERERVYSRVLELLDTVGLSREYYSRYPHEFSGGQRQRAGIARALALNPKLIICDEPVSALDVSIQSQIINLLMDLQQEFGLTYLFIAHDLSVVEHISDRVAVMYLGKIVEMADAEKLYRDPQHPYTRALLSAIPHPGLTGRKQRIVLKGDIPGPLDMPRGCSFHPRCPEADAGCRGHDPALRPLQEDPAHLVSCLHRT